MNSLPSYRKQSDMDPYSMQNGAMVNSPQKIRIRSSIFHAKLASVRFPYKMVIKIGIWKENEPYPHLARNMDQVCKVWFAIPNARKAFSTRFCSILSLAPSIKISILSWIKRRQHSILRSQPWKRWLNMFWLFFKTQKKPMINCEWISIPYLK